MPPVSEASTFYSICYRIVLNSISWIFSLLLERCGTLACFPPPVGVLRDAQGVPGETGEPSGGAAWFHSVKTRLHINDGIVCSRNEADTFKCLWHSCPCRCKQREIGAWTRFERKLHRWKTMLFVRSSGTKLMFYSTKLPIIYTQHYSGDKHSVDVCVCVVVVSFSHCWWQSGV